MPISKENKDKYPSNWKEIVAKVRLRSGDRCETCNVKNGEWIIRGMDGGIEVYQDQDGKIFRTANGEYLYDNYVGELDETNGKDVKIVLTVAHIDQNPENNDMKNLRHECQLHHLRRDISQHKKSRAETLRKKKGQISMEL